MIWTVITAIMAAVSTLAAITAWQGATIIMERDRHHLPVDRPPGY